jgi:hypothetical protein
MTKYRALRILQSQFLADRSGNKSWGLGQKTHVVYTFCSCFVPKYAAIITLTDSQLKRLKADDALTVLAGTADGIAPAARLPCTT